MSYEILRLTDRPELKETAARWFHEKWGVPLESYLDSMEECLSGAGPVPQWYAAVDSGAIIGGLGVIENDFRPRKDPTSARSIRRRPGGGRESPEPCCASPAPT